MPPEVIDCQAGIICRYKGRVLYGVIIVMKLEFGGRGVVLSSCVVEVHASA